MYRVGAVAVGHRFANAVGAVRLWCEPGGLRIDLVGVRRFAAGFAPVGEAHGATFYVPYAAVRGLTRDGETLLLSLDPRAAAPYNRFALVSFSRHGDAALLATMRRRMLWWWLSLVLPFVAGLAALALVPSSLAGGAMGLGAIALVVAVAVAVSLRKVTSWVGAGGPTSRRLRDELEQRIGERLGLAPSSLGIADPAVPASAIGSALSAASRPLRLGLVGGLALAGGLAAALAVRRYGVAERVTLPVPDAERGVAARIAPLLPASRMAVTPGLPECRCERPQTPLWSAGVPRLSVVVVPRRGSVDAVWLAPGAIVPVAGDGGDELELDVGVVNNAAETLDTVSLVVTFWRRGRSGAREDVTERALHWPGTLGPGETVKWRVRGAGSELTVVTPFEGTLGESIAPASADAFHRLRTANLSAVRLHGAMMLAYLGDPRAATAARSLDGLSAAGARARDAVLESLEPISVCAIDASGAGARACVHNGSEALVRAVELTSDEGQRWHARDLFFPGRGLRVELPLAAGESLPARIRAAAADPPER